MREAARRAHVLDDIEEFPDGFETVVGERGITLSGGQRQRIALARALALDPSILILDDALSSVDAATEEGILKELRGARAGRTCFIVAHRLSAVRDADMILVLDEGRIAEQGTHDAARRARRLLRAHAPPAAARGRARGERRVTPALHEEELLGKVYDTQLMRRLWPYLRPHWMLVAASVALIPLRVVLEMIPASLFGSALNHLAGIDEFPGLQIARRSWPRRRRASRRSPGSRSCSSPSRLLGALVELRALDRRWR